MKTSICAPLHCKISVLTIYCSIHCLGTDLILISETAAGIACSLEKDQLGVRLRKGGQESLRMRACVRRFLNYTTLRLHQPGDDPAATGADIAVGPLSREMRHW